jgi:endonuclease YncB( thermonuclease family)
MIAAKLASCDSHRRIATEKGRNKAAAGHRWSVRRAKRHFAPNLPLCLGAARVKRSLLCLILAFIASSANAQIVAVDGDTIRVGNERIRIIGLDTPETYFAKCDAERRRGYQAAGRLQRLLNSRAVRIERTGKRDKYRRTLAKVYVGGEDVAAIMVREGYARLNHGEKRRPWC